ncbi:hypothetical protein KIH39_00495 [Telmatocola sphagniphila]|uniref:HEAT repeat domain-containing protein n=1 Tax=Telmatocola sphagniphila TaxID=1123043 RepID=A0A8E6B636_9BACT|nr:hypothetical protein [Telmatocola sphagniphila]QVL32431.1 hypothetical protein KIH39_00495 [Telmatocola sphagniphila]
MLLLVPPALLCLIAFRTTEGSKPKLIGSAVFSVMFVIGLIRDRGVWNAATGWLGVLHFAICLGALWISKIPKDLDFWAANAGFVSLPIILLLLPAAQALTSVRRRARLFVNRLASRSHWPEDLNACSQLPEVRILQGLLVQDAEPALGALSHPKPQVRLIVLTALQARESWLPGQAERVFHCAFYAQEPAVRAAALRALANVRDPYQIQKIADFCTDSAPEVRYATFEALLYNAVSRWPETRRWIHTALHDRRFIEDGPLPLGTQILPSQALDDISVWACEPGQTSRRALLSLIVYYRTMLQRNRTAELLSRLYSQLVDSRLHSTLRVEIAFVLRDQAAFSPEVLRKMIEHHQPSQIRLLAASELLSNGFDESALETLREVARQPNREIALGVAQVLQATMQIDMGLPANGEVPAANTRAAAEIARRVTLWTQGKWPNGNPEEIDSSYHQTPAARNGTTATVKRPVVNVQMSSLDTPWLE